MRDTLAHTGRGVWQRLRHPLSPNREIVDLEEIWALRDVNFEIQQGERVGIIGRNGAGKSTLLKILSRITHPTTGRVTITGRVASLLEVGTGFHPELTGRENIYLNGAILGMTRQEIKKKFDEIVAFAEVEKFLDTPVKHYSSGMHVRLAFAVAAHLEPEILLVDEVLAVGDAQFQKKCLGKMEDVAKEGRTVLFVSHQMPSIQAFCERALLLGKGRLLNDDKTDIVVSYYLTTGAHIGDKIIDLRNYHERTHSVEKAIYETWIEDIDGNLCSTSMMGGRLTFCFRFAASRSIHTPGFGVGIEDIHGRRLFSANNYIMRDNNVYGTPSCQSGVVKCTFDSLPLFPGTYYASIALVENERFIIDYIERILLFHVEPSNILGTGKIFEASQGIFFIAAHIELEKLC